MRAEAPIMGVGTLPKLGIILFILTVLLSLTTPSQTCSGGMGTRGITSGDTMQPLPLYSHLTIKFIASSAYI